MDESKNELNDLLGSDDEETNKNANELDDLLGASDDSDDAKKGNVDSKTNSNELEDLLGGSDDDNDRLDVAVEEPNKPAVDEYLDQILGKADVPKSSLKESKAKTSSTIRLSDTYKVPDGCDASFVRTPNFIKIQMDEFDEALFDAETERKLFDGSTAIVRWRIKRDSDGEVVRDSKGRPMKESNARILHWADGTIQLVVGDAVFACKAVDIDNWYVI
jgi:hypothetical protein